MLFKPPEKALVLQVDAQVNMGHKNTKTFFVESSSDVLDKRKDGGRVK